MTEALREAARLAVGQAIGTGPVEALAVLAGIAYILLAIRQKRLCWVFGGASTALYVLVFLEARLYLQSALQVVYVLLAIQGWRAWRGEEDLSRGLAVRRDSTRAHLTVLAATVLLTAATAAAMARWSDSAAPWADALGTWASLAATWLMIRKVAANWLWWIVIDAGLAVLFDTEGLVFTALLDTISGAWAFIIEAGAGLGLVLIARWFWWRVNAWSELAAMLTPFAVYAWVKTSTTLEFPVSLFLIVSVTTAVWIAVTLLTKPSDLPARFLTSRMP